MAPPIGEDARGHFEQRDKGGVGGRHDRDGGGVETDLGLEQLLNRNPQHETLQPGADLQWAQPPDQAVSAAARGRVPRS
jgi:hypothetical protein